MKKIILISIALLLPLLILSQTASDDMKKRKMIMKVIRDMETAYETKKIAFFESVYNENTLFINGVQIKRKGGVEEISHYETQWKSYRQQLIKAFNSQDDINVNYSNLKITKHSNKYYSVTSEMVYKSKQHEDKGIVFLLFDFSEKIKPSIMIRTWQDIKTPVDQLFTMKSFESLLLVDEISNLENTTSRQDEQSVSNHNNISLYNVDTDIPETTQRQDKTFAIIIANEDYQTETKVEYAKNDGEVFKSYCHKTLGLPEKNVHFMANATLNNIIGELDWLQQVCHAYGGDASVIFYYAGHGIPDEDTGSSYLMPTDGNSRLLRTCFSIHELYETLGKLPAKKVTVLMDACFSGAKRNGGMLTSARGVAIKTRPSDPKGSMIILSAAQGNETAYKYEDAKHGLFTYFLLKKLKDSKGDVTMGELSRYIQDQVQRYSIVENGKSQTPTVQASDNLRDRWESMKFE